MEQFSSDCFVCGGRGRDVAAGSDALGTVMGFICPCPMQSSIAPHRWLQYVWDAPALQQHPVRCWHWGKSTGLP